MEITIYADVLFATNFLMDLVILFLTVQLSRNELNLGRLTLATTLFALYGTLSFLPELSSMLSGIGRFLMGMGAVRILKPSGGWRGFWKARAILSMVSTGMGGVIYALMVGTNLGRTIQGVSVNGAVYFLLDIRLLLAGILMSYGLLLWFRKICVRNFSKDRVLIPLEFTVGCEKIIVTALADTGCELTAPVTGAGMLLVSEQVLKGITPKNSFWLPIHTASGDDRIPAFYPDEISSLSNQYDLEEKPAIGIIKGRLSRDGLYSGILNPEILGEKNKVGGRNHENETTTVATVLFGNLAQVLSHSSKGSVLYRGKRNPSVTSWQGGRSGTTCQVRYSGGTGTGTEDTHREKSSVGGLHSSEV